MASIFDGLECSEARKDESYPFFIEVYWNECGVDEDGEEVQRIEGYGFDDRLKFNALLLDLIGPQSHGQIERLIIDYRDVQK